MIYNLDVCHAVVECTPAPKATKDMRKRKIAHRRLQLCYKPRWVTVACMADPLIVCILVALIMIRNWSNLQQWSRNKDAHQVIHRNIFCAMLHFNETLMRCDCTSVVPEKHCNDTARNVYVYLQTAVSIFYYWQASQVSAVVTAMILLLSGDIELNPGPLTVDDLKAVRNSVWDARAKWMDIGIELEIKLSRLEAIKSNHSEVGSCLTAMLTDWLKQTTPQPTWEALINALKSQIVGDTHLADAIQSKYCKKGEQINRPFWEYFAYLSAHADPAINSGPDSWFLFLVIYQYQKLKDKNHVYKMLTLLSKTIHVSMPFMLAKIVMQVIS